MIARHQVRKGYPLAATLALKWTDLARILKRSMVDLYVWPSIEMGVEVVVPEKK